jgi:formylglycine-generating enzyme required for sulfatase activity
LIVSTTLGACQLVGDIQELDLAETQRDQMDGGASMPPEAAAPVDDRSAVPAVDASVPRGDDATAPPDAPSDADAAARPDVQVGPQARCAGLASTCGTPTNKSCCDTKLVNGGTFNRSDDPNSPATVSDFYLDVYEVTVGRFRAFVNSGTATANNPPAPGAGAHPKISGSGWSSSFNASLVANVSSLKATLHCDAAYPVWTDTPGANETMPMNCLSWYDAFAFCAWDGGRLPTEAEARYAFTGGSEQRDYPWGTGLDISKATYGCLADGSQQEVCAITDILSVGSKSPQGDGKWGQADLAGNIREWVLDWYAPTYVTPCVDCANLSVVAGRVMHGAAFGALPGDLLSSFRGDYFGPAIRDNSFGVRCARELP